jgi:MFS transporter, DHA2 family, metal-tetracycline-proton antiporter
VATRFQSQLLILAISMGVFASVTSSAMLTIAFPDIARDFGISFSTLQWRNILFFALFACGLPFFGKLSDRFGTRRQFLIGLSLFSIVTLLSSFMKNWYGFLLFQSLQAVADSMIVAVQNTLIRTSFPEHKIGWAFGWFSAVLSASALIGPSLSGFILTYSDWHMIFWVLCAIALLTLLLCYFVIPSTPPSMTEQPIPYLSTLCVFIAIISIQVLFFDSITSSVKTVDSLVLFAALVILLVSERRKIGAYLFPKGALQNKIFTTASIRAFLLFIQTNATALYAPSFLRDVQGLSPRSVGLILLIAPVIGLLAAGLTGRLADKGPRTALGTGIVITLAGMLLYTQTDTLRPVWYFMMIMLLLGLGSKIVMPSQNRIVLLSVPKEQTGSYMGVFQMLQFVSGAFAAGLFGPIVQSAQGSGHVITSRGFHEMILIATGAQVLAFLTIFYDRKVERAARVASNTPSL